jgi:hypothetical protein
MTDREDALRYAARRRGLSLIRIADGSYALVRYERTGATLDEIEAYLGTDDTSEQERERQQYEAQTRQASYTEAMIRALLEEELERSKASKRKTEKIARGTSNNMPRFSAMEWPVSLSPKRR